MDIYTHRIQIQGPTGTRTIDLSIGSMIIGRQAGCDLVLEDTLISRRHARLDVSAMDCTITDLNSSNGTRVNNERLLPDLPRLLASGETIQIGEFVLAYEQVTNQEVAVPPPPPKIESPQDELRAQQPAEAKPPAKPARKTAPIQEMPPVSPPSEPPPQVPHPPVLPSSAPSDESIPLGLELRSRKLIQYLPEIYHTDFMERFLGIFEATLTPIEWTIDNFDLFLSPRSAPQAFLPWLANWFNISLDATWTDEKRRLLLLEAHAIYARLGTRWALSRVLEIYTGSKPEIDDTNKDLEPHTFRVRLTMSASKTNRVVLEQLINLHKPAYTTYTLDFTEK
jgi:phage tail-like protein